MASRSNCLIGREIFARMSYIVYRIVYWGQWLCGYEQVYSNHGPDFSTPLRFARNDKEMDTRFARNDNEMDPGEQTAYFAQFDNDL